MVLTTLYFCWTLNWKKNNWDRRWIGVTRWRCTWWWSLWRSCGTSFFHCRRGRWWSSTGSGNWDSTKNAWRMGSPGLGWIRGYSITPYFQVMKFGHLEVFFEQPDPRNDHHGLGKPRIQVRPGMIHPPSGLPKTGNFFSGTTSFSESLWNNQFFRISCNLVTLKTSPLCRF